MTFNKEGLLEVYLTNSIEKKGYSEGKLWFYDPHRAIETFNYKYEVLAWIVDPYTVVTFETPDNLLDENHIPLKVLKEICVGHTVIEYGNDILIDNEKVSPSLICGGTQIRIQCMR